MTPARDIVGKLRRIRRCKRAARAKGRVGPQAARITVSRGIARTALLLREEHLTQVRRTRGAVEPAAKPTQSVISTLANAFQVKVLSVRLYSECRAPNSNSTFLTTGVLEERDQRLRIVVMRRHLGVHVARGRYADCLIVDRCRRLQDIRGELSGIATELITRRTAHFAGPRVEQTAFEVQLRDVLLRRRADLQHRLHGVQAIGRRRGATVEDGVVETGGAGVATELKPGLLPVALLRKVLL